MTQGQNGETTSSESPQITPLQIVNVDEWRKKQGRLGTAIVNLSAPGNPNPLIVEVELVDTEQLILQDRLPQPLQKSAVEVTEEYRAMQQQAEEIDPSTGKKRGIDTNKLKAGLEMMELLLETVLVNPGYCREKDAGRGAVQTDGKLTYSDFGQYELSSIWNLYLGGLAQLERFRTNESRAADNANGLPNGVSPEQRGMPERTEDSAILAGRSAVPADAARGFSGREEAERSDARSDAPLAESEGAQTPATSGTERLRFD